jgi:HAMP domain-containing protein
MNRQDMEKVQIVFEAARAVPETERDPLLDRLCDGDQAMAAEVRALLKTDGASRPWDANTRFAPELSPAMDIRAGDEIGPHRILEQIGEGGMGVIYKALDTRLERHVALKFLPADMHRDAEIRQRFLAEAGAASRPNTRIFASSLAHDVSMVKMDVPECDARSRDEIATLASSFDRMRRSLVNALNMLND